MNKALRAVYYRVTIDAWIEKGSGVEGHREEEKKRMKLWWSQRTIYLGFTLRTTVVLAIYGNILQK